LVADSIAGGSAKFTRVPPTIPIRNALMTLNSAKGSPSMEAVTAMESIPV
jgi:hypothetical protein